jgi:hypothetical protein
MRSDPFVEFTDRASTDPEFEAVKKAIARLGIRPRHIGKFEI